MVVSSRSVRRREMFARCGLRDGKTRRGVSDDDLGTDGERAAARRIDRAVDSLTRAMSLGTFCVAAEASAGASSASSASSDEDAFSTGDGASDGDGAERRRESERGTSGSARGRMLWEDEWPSVESMSLINRAIFQAPPKSYDDKSHPWSPAHCVRLRSGAGYDFPCVWVPCRRTKAERVIIHCHANACDVGHIHTLCSRDAECWRANVLLVEYPGYGTSEGVAYEASVDRHVAAAYVYVSEECDVNPSDIWVLGRSLGTGPATKLAAAVESLHGSRLGGVILHSPFTSVKEAGLALLGQIAQIMTDRWDNREWIGRYNARTLIVHALEDEVVPYAHAKVLNDIRTAHGLPCKLYSTHGTHNFFSYYRDYLQPILEFIDAGIKPGMVPRKIAPLPDPIPRADFSESQVRKIMAMVKAQAPDEDEDVIPIALRFYGMVDSVGETITTSTKKKNGFSRFGSSSSVSETAARADRNIPIPPPIQSPKTPIKTRSISPTSTIVGTEGAAIDNASNDEMILTPGGAKPRLV